MPKKDKPSPIDQQERLVLLIYLVARDLAAAFPLRRTCWEVAELVEGTRSLEYSQPLIEQFARDLAKRISDATLADAGVMTTAKRTV
jgi:hypothetical protein